MNEFFDDEIVHASGNEMFDDDIEDITKEDEEEIDEEDVLLAEMGIQPKFKDTFKKHKNKKVFHPSLKPEHLTKTFFKFYLENCDKDMLKHIKTKKLPENLQELLKKAEPVEVIGEKSTIEQYIEKNAELIDKNNRLEKDNDILTKSVVKLYKFMGNKMQFKEDVKITDSELELIEQIKGWIE